MIRTFPDSLVCSSIPRLTFKLPSRPRATQAERDSAEPAALFYAVREPESGFHRDSNHDLAPLLARPAAAPAGGGGPAINLPGPGRRQLGNGMLALLPT
jgi:hypothetical protein